MRGLDPGSDRPDYDKDGLIDGLEVHQLGTDVASWDTDGDYITDTLEIQGFAYNNNRWYLDPLNSDTDHDGLPDGAECYTLTIQSKINPVTVMQECDTDQDGTPDPFDRDSDSDSVPDRMDLSAANLTDLNGIHRSGYSASSVAPFNRASLEPVRSRTW